MAWCLVNMVLWTLSDRSTPAGEILLSIEDMEFDANCDAENGDVKNYVKQPAGNQGQVTKCVTKCVICFKPFKFEYKHRITPSDHFLNLPRPPS